MQDYISSHPERIGKFRLALWNLIQWDIAGHRIYIPNNGRVEPCGSEDPDEVGSLFRLDSRLVYKASISQELL